MANACIRWLKAIIQVFDNGIGMRDSGCEQRLKVRVRAEVWLPDAQLSRARVWHDSSTHEKLSWSGRESLGTFGRKR